jgi:NAD(P)-dependent dehydrogenase (short-subunit alcohol dehydrogenase family)
MDKKSLSNKVCVVTGGGQGIGRAICQRLADDGAMVAVWDIDLALAEATKACLEPTETKHIAVEVDVSNSASVHRAAHETRTSLGPVHVLVNNAATLGLHPDLVSMEDEQWERTIAVNLGGDFRCIRALAPDMIEAREGSIVNIAALTAFTGVRNGSAAYAASKGGIVALTYAAAAQLSEFGVRVNAVAPGTTMTPRAAVMPEARKTELFRQITLRPGGGEARLAEPAEVANAVWFLASPSAGWITGTTIVCSGGQLMR